MVSFHAKKLAFVNLIVLTVLFFQDEQQWTVGDGLHQEAVGDDGSRDGDAQGLQQVHVLLSKSSLFLEHTVLGF